MNLPYTCSLSPSASLSVLALAGLQTDGPLQKEEWHSQGPRNILQPPQWSSGNTSDKDEDWELKQNKNNGQLLPCAHIV